MNLLERLAQITTFVFDVDGVMTDGSLIIMPGGEYIRTLNIKDGYALQLAVKKGYRVWVITGSFSTPVAERLAYLGITAVYQRIGGKLVQLQALMAEHEVPAAEILYMGDDIPDLEVMQHAGIAVCPADAAPEIRQISHYLSPMAGGRGCVRDVIEKVMKLQGRWLEGAGVASI